MNAYETFMKHAKRLTNSKVAKDHHHSSVLQGVKHFEDGRLAVTDSHRLYFFNAGHDKGDGLITPTGEEIREGSYPEVKRLIPDHEPTEEIYFDVKDILTGTDVILVAAKASGEEPTMEFSQNELRFDSIDIKASHELPKQLNGELYSNAGYWVDALKLFRALGYDKVCFKFYGPNRPFLLESLDRKLTAVIMPIRRR